MLVCLKSLKITRCRSPPSPFNLNLKKLNGGNEMNKDSKCFIKIGKDIYEEITLKELKNRQRKNSTYKEKRFIPIQRNVVRSFK